MEKYAEACIRSVFIPLSVIPLPHFSVDHSLTAIPLSGIALPVIPLTSPSPAFPAVRSGAAPH